MPDPEPGTRPASDHIPADRQGTDARAIIEALVPVLDAEPALQDSLPKIAQGLGESLGWDTIVIWLLEPGADRLRCATVWSSAPQETKEFERRSLETAFAEGEGLPGRAWRSRVPVWSSDPADDDRLALLRVGEDPSNAYAVPLVTDDRLVGVIEMAGRSGDHAEIALQHILVPLGAHLGAAFGRRMAEEAAGSERARLEVALAAGQMGVWDWDVESNRLRWSGALEEIFGVEVGTFAGTVEGYFERIHPDDQVWVIDSYLQQFEHGGADHIRLEHRFIRPDGDVGWLQVRGRAIARAGGGLVSMTGVALDITGRVAREQDARSQRAQLDLIAEVTGVGTWSWDRARQVAHWSDELASMAGLEPVARDLTLEETLSVTHPDDAWLADRLREAVAEGRDIHERYRIVRPDGEVRRLEVWGRPLHDVSGEQMGIAGITLDVTDSVPGGDASDGPTEVDDQEE